MFSFALLFYKSNVLLPFGSILTHHGRWAAKEAAYKAFGTMRIPFPDICVRSDSIRKPMLVFEGETKDIIEASGVGRSFVSLSHDGDYAVAQVILECAPEGRDAFTEAVAGDVGVVPEYAALLGNKVGKGPTP